MLDAGSQPTISTEEHPMTEDPGNLARLLQVTVVATAVGAGLAGGVMFAFSTSIMPGLRQLSARQSIEAMTLFNRTIVNPVFLVLFVGSAAAAVLLLALAPFTRGEPGGGLRLAGALLLLIGVFVVSGAGNIPMNDHLDTVDPAGATAAKEWADYVGRWVALNNLRTAAAVVSSVLLVLSRRG
jgi:uncharacterized membrane protein